ncbi:hypothetical protein [Clostridium novyi]
MINLAEIIKNQINYGTMDKDELQEKINVFFLVNQLTKEEYQELTKLINDYKNEKEKELKVKEKLEEETEHSA